MSDQGTRDTIGRQGESGTDPDMSLTTAEAASIAGVSPRTVRRWIERGTVPAATGAGGVLYVFRRDLQAARTATHARPARRDTGGARDTSRGLGGVPDSPGQTDASRLAPDPGGDAAGAILVAWRDTVLAPVVEQLAVVTQTLLRLDRTWGALVPSGRPCSGSAMVWPPDFRLPRMLPWSSARSRLLSIS